MLTIKITTTCQWVIPGLCVSLVCKQRTADVWSRTITWRRDVNAPSHQPLLLHTDTQVATMPHRSYHSFLPVDFLSSKCLFSNTRTCQLNLKASSWGKKDFKKNLQRVLLQGRAPGISKVLKLNGNSATGKIHKMFLTQIRQIKKPVVNLPKAVNHQNIQYEHVWRMWLKLTKYLLMFFCHSHLTPNLYSVTKQI